MACGFENYALPGALSYLIAAVILLSLGAFVFFGARTIFFESNKKAKAKSAMVATYALVVFTAFFSYQAFAVNIYNLFLNCYGTNEGLEITYIRALHLSIIFVAMGAVFAGYDKYRVKNNKYTLKNVWLCLFLMSALFLLVYLMQYVAYV